MDSTQKSRLTEPILTEIAKAFGLAPYQLAFLGDWQNFVYRVQAGGQRYILRITHKDHRSPEMVASELDFISHLAQGGVRACRPVAPVRTVGEFTGALFEHAPGEIPGSEIELGHLVREVGRVTGQMHRLARSYSPADDVVRRFEWHQNHYLRDLPRYVPQDQAGVHLAHSRLIEQLRRLPVQEESYGLIHADIVRGNFFWHEGQIHLFDFDESQYCWFINDLAVYLFYFIPFPKEDRSEVCRRVLYAFLEGYAQEHSLSPFWLRQLPLFLRLRQLVLYSALYRSADLGHPSPWQQRFLTFSYQNLMQDEPFIDYDFWN